MSYLKKLSVLILFFSAFVSLQAQEQLQHEMKTYTSAEGKLYWNRLMPVYIWISSSPEGEKKLLDSKRHKDYVNPYYFDDEGIHFIRTDWATDQETKKMITPAFEVKWPVWADGIAPISKLITDKASRKLIKGQWHLGKNQVKIKSTDGLAGVEKIYYSLNGATYVEYKDEVKIDKEGDYVLKYYAVDNVGNVEKPKEKKFKIDLNSPKTFHNITGINLNGNVISSSSKIYLKTEDNSVGVKATYYKIDDRKEVYYTGKNIPIYYLKNGNHTITYYSVDQVGNKELAKTFDFYLDKLAPILTSDVLGDKYIVGDKVYFSGRTKLKLTAVDNKSGVKETMYSVDKGKYLKYDQPFYLPSVKGVHVVEYYAVDNVQNSSVDSEYNKYKHKVERIYVDLTGPTIKCNYLGKVFNTRDTVFINNKTKIKLTAFDKESGLQYMSYSIDGEREETKYEKPFSINISGLHKLEYFAYDNVNNRNRGAINFFADNEGPTPDCQFSIKPIGKKDNFDIYPSYVLAYLSATDAVLGTHVIYYSLNGAPEKKFTQYFGNFAKDKLNVIKVRALDKLHNESILEVKFYVQ